MPSRCCTSASRCGSSTGASVSSRPRWTTVTLSAVTPVKRTRSSLVACEVGQHVGGAAGVETGAQLQVGPVEGLVRLWKIAIAQIMHGDHAAARVQERQDV